MAAQRDPDAVRIAIIGAGRMGQRAVELLSRRPGVEVVAVLDPDVERAASSGARAVRRMQELDGLADAVYIASPSALHGEHCIAAAKLGVDILVDKPLALSSTESDEVIRAVRFSGVRLMVGFSYRYRAEWRQAHDWVHAGRIGAVTLITDTVVEAATETPDWYWRTADGGGVIQLQSHHLFDRIAWIAGVPVLPRAAVVGPADGRAERHLSVLATAGSAPVGLTLGFADGYDDAGAAQLLVQGERGHIVVDSVRRTATLVCAGEPPVVMSAGNDDWFAAELDAFVAGAADGEPGVEEGAAAVAAAEEVLRLVAGERLSELSHMSRNGSQ
ncbi:Gfo/Idh/MocA family protein [Microbacterium sp. 2MCAF23]|uniref:Gfo/Idh/MocA family protein n=1 Tax=Microbacterium sp. 2MCAF23 TaxID=3232985 RepID=UPI003F9DD373